MFVFKYMYVCKWLSVDFHPFTLLPHVLSPLQLKENTAVVKDNVPDIYVFELSGLRVLQSEYGKDSAQVIDAQNILADFLQQVVILQTLRELPYLSDPTFAPATVAPATISRVTKS